MRAIYSIFRCVLLAGAVYVNIRRSRFYAETIQIQLNVPVHVQQEDAVPIGVGRHHDFLHLLRGFGTEQTLSWGGSVGSWIVGPFRAKCSPESGPWIDGQVPRPSGDRTE